MSAANDHYLTSLFVRAAEYGPEHRAEFLSNLYENRFFHPKSNDNAFRDLAVYSVETSAYDVQVFAAHLNIPVSLLQEWQQGRHIPLPHNRPVYVRDMIDLALCTGTPSPDLRSYERCNGYDSRPQ